jgi:hypothetical protein
VVCVCDNIGAPVGDVRNPPMPSEASLVKGDSTDSKSCCKDVIMATYLSQWSHRSILFM